MDNDFNKDIIDSLGNKVLSIVSTSLALASQGYVINKAKRVRAEWSSLLIHAYSNLGVLNRCQQKKIEQLYNKIMAI